MAPRNSFNLETAAFLTDAGPRHKKRFDICSIFTQSNAPRIKTHQYAKRISGENERIKMIPIIIRISIGIRKNVKARRNAFTAVGTRPRPSRVISLFDRREKILVIIKSKVIPNIIPTIRRMIPIEILTHEKPKSLRKSKEVGTMASKLAIRHTIRSKRLRSCFDWRNQV